MKTRFVIGVFAVCCGVAGAQFRPQLRLTALNEQDKKTVAHIVALQHKIEEAESQANAYQMQLKEMVQKASKPVKASLVGINVKPAIITNTFGAGEFIINEGTKNNSLRVDDKILVIRQQTNGSIIVKGIGKVIRAYDTDVFCVSIDNRGILPEDEAYVLNRCSSPHYITRLKFALEDR